MQLKFNLKWYEKFIIFLFSPPGKYKTNVAKYWFEKNVKRGGVRA